MLQLIYSACHSQTCNLMGGEGGGGFVVLVSDDCTGSYHELLEQILLVQLVLQDLDDSFDPGA